MNLLRDRDNMLGMMANERKGSYFFDTYLMQALETNVNGRNDNQIKNLTRRLDVFSYGSLFIPLNVGNCHWTLIVIRLEKKEIYYYDSLYSSGEKYTAIAMGWLANEMKVKTNTDIVMSEWHVIVEHDNPKQYGDPNECGMFTIMCADFLSDGLPLNYSLSQMPFFRLKVTADILRGSLKYQLSNPDLIIDK
jgi:Ulp1 family protease